MLDKDGFEAWAAEYDAAVDSSQNDGTYPFCGYGDVQREVSELVSCKKTLLDLGVGTARLTSRLYGMGIKVCGVDFSQNMINAARKKMPDAELICADLTKGMPPELEGRRFGAITAMYSIHHLTDSQKAEVINAGLGMLEKDGLFVIGDVAFYDDKEREACRTAAGGAYDDAEYYCVVEKLRPLIRGELVWKKISFCAGVIVIKNIA